MNIKVSVSLPADMVEWVDSRARAQRKTRSGVLQDILRPEVDAEGEHRAPLAAKPARCMPVTHATIRKGAHCSATV
jgi:metal-responsive CopG/Arc/MetJ family transcriptional regulator